MNAHNELMSYKDSFYEFIFLNVKKIIYIKEVIKRHGTLNWCLIEYLDCDFQMHIFNIEECEFEVFLKRLD